MMLTHVPAPLSPAMADPRRGFASGRGPVSMAQIIASLVAAMLPAMPAVAQIAPGLSGSSSQQNYTGQVAWDTLGEFGRCFAATNHKGSFELVSTRAGSVDEAKVYKRLFRAQNQNCLGMTNQLTVPFQMVRGAVAEGLYRKAIPVPANLLVATPPTAENVRNFGDAALCYAAANSDQIHALAKTRVGSKAEVEAIAALLPAMSSCFPPNAQKMPEMAATLMRFRLTEALWKLGQIPQGARR